MTLTFLDQAGLDWAAVTLEDFGRFVGWLRLPPVARSVNVLVLLTDKAGCGASTINRKLSTVTPFHTFHTRHGVDCGA